MDAALLELINQLNLKTDVRRADPEFLKGIVLHMAVLPTLEKQLQYTKKQGTGYGTYITPEGKSVDITNADVTKVPQHILPNYIKKNDKTVFNPARIETSPGKNLSNINTLSAGIMGKEFTPEQQAALLETVANMVAKNNLSMLPNSNIYPIFGHGELQYDRSKLASQQTPEGAQFANMFRSPSSSYANFMNRVMELQQRAINAKESLKR